MANNETKEIRIDKFLWAVRFYKTRSLATDACKKGHIIINNVSVKPSRDVVEGTEFSVKSISIYRTYKILKLLNSRIGAKFVSEYIEETTSQEDLLKLQLIKQMDALTLVKRDKGTGRPTKKDRRDIDKFISE